MKPEEKEFNILIQEWYELEKKWEDGGSEVPTGIALGNIWNFIERQNKKSAREALENAKIWLGLWPEGDDAKTLDKLLQELEEGKL